MNRIAAMLLAILASFSSMPGAAFAEESAAVLRVGDQRGATRALLEAAGQLENLPYRIEWALFPVGAPLVEALNARAIDFGYVGDATTTFGLAVGASIKTINVWKMQGQGVALLVPRASAYKSIADLKGKRIAVVRGSPGHLLVLAALKKAGLTAKDVTVVYLSAADAKSALVRGDVDAWSIWDPYVATAELHDNMRVLLTGDGVIDEVECGVATDEAIATKRKLLLDFIRRVQIAYRWGESHLEERAQSFTKETGTPLDVSRLTYSRQHITVLGSVTDDAVRIHQNVADLYAEAGIIPNRIDVAKAYDRSFVVTEK